MRETAGEPKASGKLDAQRRPELSSKPVRQGQRRLIHPRPLVRLTLQRQPAGGIKLRLKVGEQGIPAHAVSLGAARDLVKHQGPLQTLWGNASISNQHHSNKAK
jgi:hypothetical protein